MRLVKIKEKTERNVFFKCPTTKGLGTKAQGLI